MAIFALVVGGILMTFIYPALGTFFLALAVIIFMLKIAGDSVGAFGFLLIIIGIILTLFFSKFIGMVLLAIGIILFIIGMASG